MTHLQTEPAPPLTDLSEMAELIKTLPNEYRLAFEQAFEKISYNMEQRNRILHFIQEALSQIRLDMKYLIFDLDATRQERDQYRAKLENER